MAQVPLYQALAGMVQQLQNNEGKSLPDWVLDNLTDRKKALADALPSGSGFDNGVKILYEESKPDRLVLSCDWHHMNDNGYYVGWTTHKAIVTPSLQYGFDLRITGRDRNSIKDYIADALHHALSAEAPPPVAARPVT